MSRSQRHGGFSPGACRACCACRARIRAFGVDSKLGILATKDVGDLPHLSLITTIQAKDPEHLTWGQFCEGYCKENVRRDPRVGFLVMTMDKEDWRGKARWTHGTREGEDFEAYNRKPLFRYNSYFGIHTVHHAEVIQIGPRERLSVPRIAAGAILAAAARPAARIGAGERALTAWAESLVNRMSCLKFVSWIGDDGYPVVVPAVPGAVAGGRRMILAATVHGRELACIPRGASVAVLALDLNMESVLARGRFDGWRGVPAMGAALGTLTIDWVYNSMPPRQGPIWPLVPLRAVTEF
ncbi:MAG: hypothetical protein A2289_22595 [Deltaproteobacteria bacterium RIFOXYA12_FULL_58_15]|nr:MAG: hypothetical protein A2289_22595 [Deltaproteobacteria bacterium RIFOXYA12_FULL_58_15]